MYLTEKEYKIALDGYSFIDDAVKKFAEDYKKEFCPSGYVTKVEFFPTSDTEATIDIEEEYTSCGCCSPDYEEFSLPVEYLWDKDWVGREKERREQKRRENELRNKEREAEREKERDEKRYQQYLAMKEEYEDG